jgi:glycosyltransferase involved in cell wall biosynthesis
MKIGLDIRPLVLGAGGGMSQLVKGVLEHLLRDSSCHEFVIFCTPFNRSLVEAEGEHVSYQTLPIGGYYGALDQALSEGAFDLLFRAYPTEDRLHFPLAKQIFLIPDNQHETYPDFFTPEVLRLRREAFSMALSEAGAIGTISEFAKDALIATRPEGGCPDFFLMPPALQEVHQSVTEADLSAEEVALIPKGPYFLFPANIWQHKNHRTLLEAFARFQSATGGSFQLILTGHPAGWEALRESVPSKGVLHLGFVRPELLRVLLERATALTFFSLYEGFGMPLLEAFDAGTPVIASNTTSLPEVGGDAILTCDPTDPVAIAGLMRQIAEDLPLRGQMIERGQHRLTLFSWTQSAKNLMAALERVHQNVSLLEDFDPLPPPNTKPLVSIVTPSYNQGRFIRRTIDSVLNQSYPAIEYLVMDGESSDETLSVLQSYGDRVRWISEKDEGQTDAINKGLRQLHGDILAYLNSDDVLTPGAIDRVVRFFNENPDIDLVYGNADYIDEEDQVIGPYKTASYSLERLLEDCMICQPATFWRRSVQERWGLFDDQLHFVMDYEYWIRLATHGAQLAFVEDKLACSRLYPETKTLSSRSKIYREIFEVSKRHAGQVHPSFYLGYWHHLLTERRFSFLTRALLPFHGVLASLHRRSDRLNDRLSQFMARPLRYQLIGILGVFGLTRPVQWLYRRLKGLPTPSGRFRGFYPDNWIAESLLLPANMHGPGKRLRLEGFSPVDADYEIMAGDLVVASGALKGGVPSSIEVASDLVDRQPITLKFSQAITDSAGRRLAFHATNTTLFTERDVA